MDPDGPGPEPPGWTSVHSGRAKKTRAARCRAAAAAERERREREPLPGKRVAVKGFGDATITGVRDGGSISVVYEEDGSTYSRVAASDFTVYRSAAPPLAPPLTPQVPAFVEPCAQCGHEACKRSVAGAIAALEHDLGPLITEVVAEKLFAEVVAANGALDLSFRCLGDADAATVACALRSGACHGLRRLDLSNNRIGPAGVAALADAMASGACSDLLCLDLYGNRFGDAGAVSMAGALTSGACNRLRELRLGGNRIGRGVGDVGVAALAEALASGACPGLRTLRLSRCSIGDVGASALAAALASGASGLQALHLPFNRFRDAGMAALAEALHSEGCANGLHTLRVGGFEGQRNCGFTYEGLAELCLKRAIAERKAEMRHRRLHAAKQRLALARALFGTGVGGERAPAGGVWQRRAKQAELVVHLRERATFVQQQYATGHAPDSDQLRRFLAKLGASVKAGLGPDPTAALKAAVVATFATIGWDPTADQPAAKSKEPPTATAVVDCIRALEVVAATAEEKRAVAARERGHACSPFVLAMPYISADPGAPPCPLLCKTVAHMPQLAPRTAIKAKPKKTWTEYIEVDNLRPACTGYIMEACDDMRLTHHVGGSKRWSAEPQQARLDPEARAKRDLLDASRQLGVSVLDPQLQPLRQAIENVWWRYA